MAAMNPQHDDWLGKMRQPVERFPERLWRPEIVGQVDNPVLETIRRFWWQALDRVCYCLVLIRLSVHDRIYGPEPPTAADLKREGAHERLIRAFPMASETIEPRKHQVECKHGDVGSPYHLR
jgi:hypothetical protein